MADEKRDKTRVSPSGAEEDHPTKPLETTPEGEPAHAANTEIPGTGEIIRDADGEEVKRVVRT